ncbi:hypothetical protein Angca_000762, partial [Angiostrongylus cantonensis]
KQNEVLDDLPIVKVYNNDLIMRHIVSFVTDINARVNIEMSSSRLHYLSKTSTWRFKSGGDTLSLTFKTLNAYISVEVGDVWFSLPCTTMQTRREGLSRRTTQPEELMKILHGMTERFATKIGNVRIGGADFEYQSKGVQNHQLIITADLLRLINDRLLSARSISVRHCGFDEGAVKYLNSEECFFPNRICELKIDSVWLDSDTLIPHFTALITSSLRVLELRNFTVANLGINLFDRMKNLGLVLDDLHVGLSPCSVQGMTVASIRSFLMNMCSVTSDMHIGVHCPRRSNGENILFALQSLVLVDNVAFYCMANSGIVIAKRNWRTIDRMSITGVSGLSKISYLRKVVCGGWKNYDVSVGFCVGLSQCSSLKEVVIKNIVTSIRGEMVTLLSGIPNIIESLQLEAIAVTDSEIVDLF